MILNPSVLVVDDKPEEREIIEIFLEDLAKLHEAKDGAEGLEKAKELLPDIILLDIRMPVMNGIEMLYELKKDDTLKKIPVIMQTGDLTPETTATCLQLGAAYYLPKPFDKEVLIASIDSALIKSKEIQKLIEKLDQQNTMAQLLEEFTLAFKTPEEAAMCAQWLAHAFADRDYAAIGLVELLLNAVEHGNLDISFEEKARLMENSDYVYNEFQDEVQKRLADSRYQDRKVRVYFKREDGTVTVRIEDEGKGFDFEKVLHPSLDFMLSLTKSGRGVIVSQTCFDSIQYHGAGNIVEVIAKGR